MQEKPRKRDKEASKQALLRAGLDVFSRYGYDAATTKMVAAEAGLNEQLITRYFGGKLGLLLAVLTAFADKSVNDDNQPVAAESVEEEIRQFLLFRHARFLELQEFFRTFVPLSIVDTSIRERIEPILLRSAEVLRDRLAGFQQRHLIRADANLTDASIMICGQSFFISFMLRVTTFIDDDHLERMMLDFAAHMARGLAPSYGPE
jgi:AcrR family transcriptional regulator